MIFFLNLDQGSPSTLGGRHWEELRQNCEQSNLEENAYVKRQTGRIGKKCEVILQKVEVYNEKKNVEECKKKIIKRKDLKKDQNQNKNPSYGKKWSLVWSP